MSAARRSLVEVRNSRLHCRRPPSMAWRVAAAVSVVLGAAACSATSSTENASPVDATRVITVGSFDFPESRLLAALYGTALEHRGFPVTRALGLGPREFVEPALARGLISLLPEYSGTALQFLTGGAAQPVADSALTHQALAHAAATVGMAALDASPAQNSNELVVTRATATAHGLRSISDLRTVAPKLVFGGPPECSQRRLCLKGLEEKYGIHFAEFVGLDVGGPLTRQALARGQIDVALLFTTDPTLADPNVVVLQDDRRLQPAENVTPLVRRDVLARFGSGVAGAVDAVSRLLTTDELRRLNADLARTDDPTRVASDWLRERGLA
jgi:osmoprotectant transport system substrate-binding protein